MPARCDSIARLLHWAAAALACAGTGDRQLEPGAHALAQRRERSQERGGQADPHRPRPAPRGVPQLQRTMLLLKEYSRPSRQI
jgi:hypothetical protein